MLLFKQAPRFCVICNEFLAANRDHSVKCYHNVGESNTEAGHFLSNGHFLYIFELQIHCMALEESTTHVNNSHDRRMCDHCGAFSYKNGVSMLKTCFCCSQVATMMSFYRLNCLVDAPWTMCWK